MLVFLGCGGESTHEPDRGERLPYEVRGIRNDDPLGKAGERDQEAGERKQRKNARITSGG